MDVIVIDFFHWTAQGDWQFDPRDFPDPDAMIREVTVRLTIMFVGRESLEPS